MQNTGFLLGAGRHLAPALVSALLLLAVTARLIYAVRTTTANPASAGLIVGGCAANVGERIWRGAVTDFIATPWIVIDIADLAIVTGLALLAAQTSRRRLGGSSHSRPSPINPRTEDQPRKVPV